MEQIRIAVLSPYNKVLTFLDNTVPSAMHYFDEILHTYLKGSSYTFEFTTMTAHDDAVFLVEGNKLSFIRKNKGYHLTIMSVEKGGDTTTVTAYGLCLELTNEYVDAYKAPRAMSFVEYINAYGFERSFVIGTNEVSNKKITHEWTGTDTVLARLYSIANVFDAELEFVTQLNDDYSLKNVVLNIYRAHSDSVQGMGTDKHSTILRYPNNIYGITKTSDITELYTAIRPTGTNGLQLNSISGRTVKDSNGNVLYKVNGNNILAPQSRDRFPSTLITNHSNDMYAVQIWSYETENVETLYGQALAQLKKNCVPKVTYDVDAYIDGDIGDTFTIEDAEYSPTLYLEARITEQEICFTDSEKCKTIFDNFEEKQSQISSALISEMNKMIELKKVYEGSIVSSNGVLFKNDSDSTKLTALVKDDGVDITSKYSITWFKDDVQISTNQTITVSASDLSEKAVYRFKAMSGEILKASAEVTVMRLQDGQNGTSAYVHIAYANSSDGRVDFSLTDSNRKFIGQYSDSKQYGSEDPTKYRWSAIKGEDGQSFVSAEEQFYYSTSKTELIGGEWFVGNVVYQSDKFLWKRWKCTYANPSEIKYTKAIFDNTWNEIDAKIGEIHTQVSEANAQSKEAVNKATQAQTDASKANELANTANTQSSEAKKLAQEVNARLDGQTVAPTQPSTPSAPSGEKYSTGTPICTNTLSVNCYGTGKVYKGDWNGTIGRVIKGAKYPYRVDRNGVAIGWTNNAGIDTDPHIPGGTTTSTPTVLNSMPSDFIRESATFYPNTTLKIRKAPTEKGIDTGLYYSNGMSVRYDGYVKREGFVWISWISASSGERRWMKAGVLNSNGYNTNPYGRFA